MFGEVQAKIISVEQHLLTVLVPARPNLLEDTVVEVSVANVEDGKRCIAATNLKFTFYAEDKMARLRKVANSNENILINSLS